MCNIRAFRKRYHHKQVRCAFKRNKYLSRCLLSPQDFSHNSSLAVCSSLALVMVGSRTINIELSMTNFYVWLTGWTANLSSDNHFLKTRLMVYPCSHEMIFQLQQNWIVYIGGSRGRAGRTPPPPPIWDQILLFSHTFLPKSTHIGGPLPPPQWVHAPPTGNPGSATGLYCL